MTMECRDVSGGIQERYPIVRRVHVRLAAESVGGGASWSGPNDWYMFVGIANEIGVPSGHSPAAEMRTGEGHVVEDGLELFVGSIH